jgi:hypothetical protein
MEKEPGMKKIDTHVPLEVWNRYEEWAQGRGNIPSRQLHTRLVEMFLALPEHLRLQVLWGKPETLQQIFAPLKNERNPVPEDVLRWCGMPLTPAWTPAERERAVRTVAQELLRRGVTTEQIHVAMEPPSQPATAESPGLPPEELAMVWPDEMKRCAIAVIGRSVPEKERVKLHRIIDEAAAAVAVQQADSAAQRHRPGPPRSGDEPASRAKP